MQKVVGSNPISRFDESPANAGFSFAWVWGASFGFDDGRTLHSRLTRTCKVR